MTDLELLGLAAKAAGIPDGYWNCEHHDHGHGEYWNPLEDDGDALRLAVLLKMNIRVGVNTVDVSYLTDKGSVGCWTEEFTEGVETSEAATRRAITSLASTIGRVKK